MLKRFFAVICLLTAVLVTLASCKIPGFGITPPTGVTYKRIVCDEDIDLLEVRSAVSDVTGSVLPIIGSSDSEGAGEIVFGDTELPITKKAKAAMQTAISKTDGCDSGYVIYYEDGNIAVYWSVATLADAAISKFINQCVKSDELEFDNGIAEYEYYNSVTLETERAWTDLEAQAPAEVIAALREAYSFYSDDKLIGWMANLYDPEIGGFYYSISARDNEPFRPDMESTNQILSILTGNGAIKDRSNELPEDIVKKIVKFVRDMQSPKDGYFYHSQWAQDKSLLNTDRYGRDLAAAGSLITSFYVDTDGDGVKEKQYPYYCIPGSQRCFEHKDGGSCSFPIASAQITEKVSSTVTRSIVSDVALAVSRLNTSKVVAAATVSSHPDYSSPEAFEAWLRAYNGDLWERDDSGNAHLIAELRVEISQRGYLDIVLDYLDEQQELMYTQQLATGEKPTGMWQRTVNYRAAWGFFKYMAMYNMASWRKIDIKYVPYIVDAYIQIIKMPPDGDYYINDLMNQWLGISRLIANVRKFYGEQEVQKIYDMMKVDAADLIYNSLDKIAPFKRADGSFSYNPDGRSNAIIYGVSISLGEVEGDVNGTLLALNMYNAFFTVFGYKAVPLFDSDDGKEFVRVLKGCEPIVKTERVFETLDFEEDEDINEVKTAANTADFKCEIVSDPKDSSNKVLYFASGPLGRPGVSDTVSFVPLSAGGGCNVLETKMYVDSKTSDGYLMQCGIWGSYIFTIHKSGKTVTFKDVSSTERAKDFDEVAKVSVDEWFTLRIEYYYPDAAASGGITAPVTKIFINGELVKTSYKYKDSDIGGVAPSTYSVARFYSLASPSTYIYFDDCYFAKETKIYNENDNSISDSRG